MKNVSFQPTKIGSASLYPVICIEKTTDPFIIKNGWLLLDSTFIVENFCASQKCVYLSPIQYVITALVT